MRRDAKGRRKAGSSTEQEQGDFFPHLLCGRLEFFLDNFVRFSFFIENFFDLAGAEL